MELIIVCFIILSGRVHIFFGLVYVQLYSLCTFVIQMSFPCGYLGQFTSHLGKFLLTMMATGAILATGFELTGMCQLWVHITCLNINKVLFISTNVAFDFECRWEFRVGDTNMVQLACWNHYWVHDWCWESYGKTRAIRTSKCGHHWQVSKAFSLNFFLT